MRILQNIFILIVCLCFTLTMQAQKNLSKNVTDISKECTNLEKKEELLKNKIKKLEEKIEKLETKLETKIKKTEEKLPKNKVYSELKSSLYSSKRKLHKALEQYVEEKYEESQNISNYTTSIYFNKVKAFELNDEERKIFKSVEQMPTFPGGDAALMKYLSSHIQYPTMAQENGIQGKVVVQFVVGKDGKVGEVKVVRSVDKELDKEAVRVCKSLPRFKPGRLNGQAVSVWYTLPFTFKLQANVMTNSWESFMAYNECRMKRGIYPLSL